MRYAQGHNALAICDRCGFRIKYLDLITEQDTSLRVCESCLDEPQPDRARRPDAIVLRMPRPDPFEGTDDLTDGMEPLLPPPPSPLPPPVPAVAMWVPMAPGYVPHAAPAVPYAAPLVGMTAPLLEMEPAHAG